MRCPRWKAPPEHPAGYYHCVSRIVDRRFVLEVLERQMFRKFLAEYAAFCGVRVLTWCVLSNHFHLLLEVPRKPDEPPRLDALIARLEFLSSAAVGAAVARQRVARWAAAGDTKSPERLRLRLWAQMYDLSAFMKLLKQRFSQWFNRTHQRTGTLWEERFRSVLIEGAGPALATVAAYIDLNPVRAGLVEDPKDYRWCGYAEAVAGNPEAQGGLATSLGVAREAVLPEYQKWLFGQGEERAGTDEAGQPLRRGFDRAVVLAVLAQGGTLGRAEMLRLRVRYLVDGAVLGSRAFVNDLFMQHRERFGSKRPDGARAMRGLPGLSALRALRMRVIT